MGIFKQALIRDEILEMPYFYWLASIEEIGIKTYVKMQSYFSSPRELFMAGEKKWSDSGVFTKAQLKRMTESLKETSPQQAYESMLEKNIRLIPFEASDFPGKLLNIPGAPKALFLAGKLPKAESPCVSVIGARECSFYGSDVAVRIGESLAMRNISLVSGMARGIDSIAGMAALKAGGYSLAVLGGGVDVLYPKESYGLYERLKSEGGILSEYAPGVAAQPVHFALRNRIISGLSDVICVVEARLKSGTMITVDAALEQGREVYVVPGRLSDVASRGCLELINQGAGIITDIDGFSDEVLANYAGPGTVYRVVSGKNEKTSTDISNLTDIERQMLSFFKTDSYTIDSVTEKLKLPYREVATALSNLSIHKLVLNMGAGRFKLTTLGIETGQFL